ncbi:hypothetical protein A2W14_02735 [Candidatus Gottesmanbacteria bacterium RBG_16_37_8]|uniref:Uncharacterized protein n=1 Tax=Candidatus Gottesmanbacteria bacterium RBG_16_37_8 TaxID=1798371 RepID=A0A1F5YPT1_9BACT|nr:MAG: hypothetical protein A2W14_02735 [Candidatus Gottesmanbacteria bacterium RBG_16_37_8]
MAGKSDITKILIVVVILIVLLTGIFVVRKRGAKPFSEENIRTETNKEEVIPKENKNTITFESDTETVTVGQEIEINLNFRAPGKNIFGSDVVLLFDPEYLVLGEEGIGASDFFATMPRKDIDSENGIIKVTAFDGLDEVLTEDDQPLFSVSFKAVKSGTTKVSLEYSKGETNTTTLVERQTSENILDSVDSLEIVIE